MAEHNNMLDRLPRLESVDPRKGSGQEPKTPDPEKSRFESWFIGQFGNRPAQKSAGRLSDAVAVAKQNLRSAEDLFERTVQWEHQYDAALKAWRERERMREVDGR
jgi:hypothetical protein